MVVHAGMDAAGYCVRVLLFTIGLCLADVCFSIEVLGHQELELLRFPLQQVNCHMRELSLYQ